jgi:hypothetical protein
LEYSADKTLVLCEIKMLITILRTIFILSSVITVFCIFMLFRNQYVCLREYDAISAVYKYSMSLIAINKYEPNINYFKQMGLNYFSFLWDIARWGKYSAIKDEYIEILKPFFD